MPVAGLKMEGRDTRAVIDTVSQGSRFGALERYSLEDITNKVADKVEERVNVKTNRLRKNISTGL